MTYDSPDWEFASDTHLLKLQRLQNKVLHTIGYFQGAHRSKNCKRLSIFRTFRIILQNYAGNKQKSYKIMKMQISAI
jgi:hypothetical protein